MDYIKRLSVLFQQRTKRLFRHPAVQRSNAQENSFLAKLPTELLQLIVNQLPVISAASFSLSCRHIYFLIGTQYLEKIATSHHETLVFLKLLEHDLPNQIVCDSCRKFHKIQDARKYTKIRRRASSAVEPDCLSNDRGAMFDLFIHKNFSSTVFKMVMKHYHQFGYDAQSRQLLNLLSQKFCRHHRGATLVRELKAECQIKNDSLFICKHVAFHGMCRSIVSDPVFFVICPHLELESKRQPAGLYITALSSLSFDEKWSIFLHCENSTNVKKTSWDFCSDLRQCGYCQTEYQASLKHGDNCTTQFTITVWKNLGQGPEAEEWKAHFPLQDWRLSPQTIRFQGGEIASVFHGSFNGMQSHLNGDGFSYFSSKGA